MATGPNESDDQPEEADGQQKSPGLEQELEELLAHPTVDLDSLPLEEQVSALKSSLEMAQKEASDNLETAQRAQAEMVNFRRRTDEDRIANAKYANSRLIANILPVLEELDLAGLGIDPATVGWVGARQEITAIAEAPAREAGEVIVDEGDAHERILAFLDDLKVL